YKVNEGDGFVVDAKIEMLLASDTPVGIAKSIGLGVIGFADALETLKSDVIVLLGDRFEILAAAQAALVARIPVAHIHGGETTEGLIDEAIRHSVTKMAQIHFVAAEPYRRRVLQLGESPERVFNFGAIGLDNVQKTKLLNRNELEASLDFKLGKCNFLVTYHPVTLSEQSSEIPMQEMLDALDMFPEARTIITKPNADTGGRIICQMIDDWARSRPDRVYVTTSLGQLRYLSAIKHVDLVIGNSSSGLIEVPAFKKPTVNLGERQSGRLKASSIIDCSVTKIEIVEAISKALTKEFKDVVENSSSPYGMGNVSTQIKNVLKDVNLDGIIMKKFYDLEAL
ncbi:MAG: UDP-N-acetylglucosamine 2-epimerase, partial [Spirochaetales bacterium]|nr:UDP-N-acetylglucosamine 2-epimerase [Spirochaetales bacterium]